MNLAKSERRSCFEKLEVDLALVKHEDSSDSQPHHITAEQDCTIDFTFLEFHDHCYYTKWNGYVTTEISFDTTFNSDTLLKTEVIEVLDTEEIKFDSCEESKAMSDFHDNLLAIKCEEDGESGYAAKWNNVDLIHERKIKLENERGSSNEKSGHLMIGFKIADDLLEPTQGNKKNVMNSFDDMSQRDNGNAPPIELEGPPLDISDIAYDNGTIKSEIHESLFESDEAHDSVIIDGYFSHELMVENLGSNIVPKVIEPSLCNTDRGNLSCSNELMLDPINVEDTDFVNSAEECLEQGRSADLDESTDDQFNGSGQTNRNSSLQKKKGSYQLKRGPLPQNVHPTSSEEIVEHRNISLMYCLKCKVSYEDSRDFKQHEFLLEKRLLCDFCKIIFISKCDFDEHLHSCHGNFALKDVYCEHCEHNFKDPFELAEHQRESDLLIKCNFCKQVLLSKCLMIQHSRNRKIVLCPKCEGIFESSCEMLQHLHPKRVSCSSCEISYESDCEHWQHLRKRVLKCFFCIRRFENPCELNQHLQSVCNICSKCEMMFESDIALENHLNCKKNVQCSVCHNHFESTCVFFAHMHSKCLKCSECKKSFETKLELALHLFSSAFNLISCSSREAISNSRLLLYQPTGCFKDSLNSKVSGSSNRFIFVRERTCKMCNKYFNSFCDFQIHRIEEDVICCSCFATYSTRCRFEQHLSLQGDDDNIRCQHCLDEFPSQCGSNLHLLSKERKCGDCGNVFPSGCKFTMHLRSNNGDQICCKCQRTFLSSEFFEKHEKTILSCYECKTNLLGFGAKCIECNGFFDEKCDLVEHVNNEKHEKILCQRCDLFRQKICYKCDRSFFSQISLIKHENTSVSCYECDVLLSGNLTAKCLKCHIVLKRNCDMVEHVNSENHLQIVCLNCYKVRDKFNVDPMLLKSDSASYAQLKLKSK